VGAAAVLAGLVSLVTVAGLGWTARLLRIGTMDALDLARKVATPLPTSAIDWPEVRVLAAVSHSSLGEPGLALLHVQWPGRPDATATLLVDLGGQQERSLGLLAEWCAASSSISPSRGAGTTIELRRRQSLDRVGAELLSEDYSPKPSGSDATRSRAENRRPGQT
jgi:hypothetical protein